MKGRCEGRCLYQEGVEVREGGSEIVTGVGSDDPTARERMVFMHQRHAHTLAVESPNEEKHVLRDLDVSSVRLHRLEQLASMHHGKANFVAVPHWRANGSVRLAWQKENKEEEEMKRVEELRKEKKK